MSKAVRFFISLALLIYFMVNASEIKRHLSDYDSDSHSDSNGDNGGIYWEKNTNDGSDSDDDDSDSDSDSDSGNGGIYWASSTTDPPKPTYKPTKKHNG
eukprot:CAMPEP_0114684124 /NCGR_PEP_ID=MMETSP0191-20121206/58706_1 /TAXON_ID=126664 /ORGANISM="Sorites sp." /LENGTH=98 /DNA_ID=CAMNT_0001966377 /DNA_START=31 /DNA_END=323 /DNA_ORIENTATION=+